LLRADNMHRYYPKHKIRSRDNFYSLKDNYWVIFGKSTLWLALGAAIGFLIFYFFKNQSVYFIDKFKFFQSIFGIREYKEGMVYINVLLAILAGNLISTGAYFTLGYLRMLIPTTIVTGFFVVLLLMTGTIRHLQAVPPEVIVLTSLETFYRMLAITTGEYLQKNRLKKKSVLVVSLVAIILLLGIAVYYEMIQIFG